MERRKFSLLLFLLLLLLFLFLLPPPQKDFLVSKSFAPPTLLPDFALANFELDPPSHSLFSPFLPSHPLCQPSGNRFIVLITPYGGLGDRLKGTLSIFFLSCLLQRHLLISPDFFSDPEYQFMLPSRLNWLRYDAVALFNSTSSKRHWAQMDMIRDNLTFFDFQKEWPEQVVAIKTNVNFVHLLFANPFLPQELRKAWLDLDEHVPMIHYALRQLISMPRPMRMRIEAIQRLHFPNETYFKIGLHLRNGDDGFPQIKSRKRRFVPFGAIHCFVEKAQKIWESLPQERRALYPGGPVHFVTSDTANFTFKAVELFRSQGRAAFETEKEGGKITHIDKGAQEHTRTFLDWWLLTKMDALIVTTSGYSDYAARYSGAPLSVFLPGKKTCQEMFADYPNGRFKIELK